MRILMVSEDIPAPQLGGLGKHAVRLANALFEKGHEVVLMGRSDVDYEACRAETGFSGRFLGGFDFRRAGWKEHSLGVFMPYKRPALARRIARAILKEAASFDVVHYHGHLPLVGRYIPQSVNFVQTRHDQGSECLMHVRLRNGKPCNETRPEACASCATLSPNRLQRAVTAIAVNQYRHQTSEAFSKHKTIFVSDFLRRRFAQVVPDSASIKGVVIHNFIDDGWGQGSASQPESGQRPVAIIVGRIDEAKGVHQLLRELVARQEILFDLWIVGDGPLRKRIEFEFCLPWLTFFGWRSPDETKRLMKSADSIVLPSVCEEACPTVVLEGLSLGKPVLALSRGGTPELSRYELWEGQLVLFDEIKDLAEGLAGNTAASSLAERHFDCNVNSVLSRLLDVYALEGDAGVRKEMSP